jgi:hypothetical protein
MINPQLERMFERYENAFQSLDFVSVSDLFSESFISAGPRGIIARTKTEFLEQSGKYVLFYKSVGFSTVKILHETEIPISENYAMVTIHWGATFRKTGDQVIEFDVSYIVHLRGNCPEIILFITHQDEQKAMKKIGLVMSEEKQTR